VLALFGAAVALYGVASALHLGFLVGLPERVLPWARRSIVAAFFVHLLELGARGVSGLHPVSTVRETIGFLAWVIVGLFLVAERRRKHLDAVGAFVAPAALVLLLAARLAPDTESPLTSALGVLGRVHILLATVGISIFALATASAVLYLLEERQLKRKKFGNILRHGTALETLDGLAHRCVQVGFPIFTLAMITGTLWSAKLSAGLRPENVIAGVAWAAFAAVLVARGAAGWRGRRAALMTILGFSSSLVVLATYLVRAVV
jgi:ABC-type uncharacterized transport system permease subunit